jgi:hypothetical protein
MLALIRKTFLYLYLFISYTSLTSFCVCMLIVIRGYVRALSLFFYNCLDLRYLLSIPPEEFDDNTRKGFLHGYSMLLDILTWMQGMDSHVR